MVDLFNEVSEDLRRERLNRAWRSYGAYVIAVAVLVVVGTAGWRGYDYWQQQQSVAAASKYLDAIKLGDEGSNADAASALLAFSSEAPAGYAVLARFRAASERAAAGETDGALGAWQQLIDDGSLSTDLRDLARLRAAMIAVDVEDYDAVSARLAPLLAEGNAWRAAARELAGLAAVRAARWEEARTHLSDLLDDEATPADVRSRAQILMDLVIGTVGMGSAGGDAGAAEEAGS